MLPRSRKSAKVCWKFSLAKTLLGMAAAEVGKEHCNAFVDDRTFSD
jgi:hypothetical protein